MIGHIHLECQVRLLWFTKEGYQFLMELYASLECLYGFRMLISQLSWTSQHNSDLGQASSIHNLTDLVNLEALTDKDLAYMMPASYMGF